tara:strand:- start:188 stop:325 length:138 start_codon:yes stop_codon:yes gene_type:complete
LLKSHLGYSEKGIGHRKVVGQNALVENESQCTIINHPVMKVVEVQ